MNTNTDTSTRQDSNKQKERQKKRCAGEEYFTRKNKKVPAKQPPENKALCKCKLKCKEITHEQKLNLFHEFYSLNDIVKQNTYAMSLIHVCAIKRRRHGTYERPEESKRQVTLSFTLPNGEGNILQVCRKTFCAVFGITPRQIETLAKLKKQGDSIYKERRGNKKLHRKFTTEDKALVIGHINTFPRDVGHYNRSKSEKQYLSSDLNINRLHSAFKEAHPNSTVTYRFYFETFKKKIPKLSFRKPRTDTCATCDLLHIETRDPTKKDAKMKLELHHRKAEAAVEAMKEDHQKCQLPTSDTMTVSMDLEQVLSLPTLTHSQMYYMRQLSNYNLCVHLGDNNTGFMFLWHEGITGRGGNEIASCILKAFTNIPTQKRKQAYLMNFGYMPKSADGAFSLRTEESIREAIKEMQGFAGIPVSGKLDERTVKLMKTPRCGLPDKDNAITSGRRKRYTIHGLKWPYTDLTWSLRTKQLAADLDPYEVRYVISRALAVWSKHSKLTFTEVDSDRADVLIYFYRKEHGDSFPFDGKGVILAHAFFPTGARASVDVHFDADENWTTSGNSELGTNLFNVAAHEIGHSLGLSHSNVEGALMYPWYTEMKDGFDYELPDDDKLAIQYLYGSREEKQWERIPPYHPQVPTYPQPTTTTTTTTTTRPTTRVFHRFPYDPRYPNGKYPYNRPEKPPHKPIHPDKKPHYPKHNHNHGTDRKHIHHRNPTTDHQPTPVTNPPYPKPTKIVPRRYPQTPQKTTTMPPKEYPNKKGPPDTCDTNYDAVAVIRRELFIFKDKYFWRIGDNGLVTTGYPAEINRLFRGFPRNLTHVDAVYERPDGNIVFFVGTKYYLFSGVGVVPGYPKSVTELGLPSMIKKIDGAMIWGHNGRTYFFSGDMYWRFDEEEQKVELDYPRNMVAMWKGVGTDIDAVFQWKDGRTYFFKGKGFWKFNDLRMRVDHWEQKLSAPVWMGCKQNYEQNDLNQKLPYTNRSSSSALMKRDWWLMGIIWVLISTVFL